MLLGSFLHRGLIVASNMAYKEKAAETKQLIDILDALLQYEIRGKELALLSREVEMVKRFVYFMRHSGDNQVRYELTMNVKAFGTIAHGSLLFLTMDAVETLQMEKGVERIAVDVAEQENALALSIAVNEQTPPRFFYRVAFVEGGEGVV